MKVQLSIVAPERINNSILVIRGEKVMLDQDLADLYGVQVKVLNQQVRRNAERFPSDFMFQATKEEAEESFVQGYKLRP